jgi:polyhydroxybutyrate depolymerase
MYRISILLIVVLSFYFNLYSIDFPFQGTIRTYNLHISKGYNPSKSIPLVVVLHGGGGTADNIEKRSRYDEIADREQFLVVYPQGYKKQWNDGRNAENIPAQQVNTDDVGFINALIDTVISRYNIDKKRIYATGPSNGGFMTTRLGCELSNKFAAIAPVISTFPKALMMYCKPASPIPIILINGTADPLVPYNGGFVTVGKETRGEVLSTDATIQYWIKNNDCSPTPVITAIPDKDKNDGCTAEMLTYKGMKANEEVIHIRIDGGGHAVPGGKQYLPKKMVGNVCEDFAAEEMIWAFFKKHSK